MQKGRFASGRFSQGRFGAPGVDGAAITASIAGLTDNPNYGATLQIGTTLTGSISGLVGGETIVHRWRTPAGLIAGASADTYLVALGGNVSDTSPAWYSPTVDGVEVNSAAYTVRHAPPSATGTIPDQNLTEGAAATTIVADVTSLITGSDLSFSVAGYAGVFLDGDALKIDPAAIVSGQTITLTATNSGGPEAIAFDLTVAAGASIAAPLITDSPDAAGEDTFAYAADAVAATQTTVTIDGTQVSDVSVPPLAAGEAFVQTPMRFTRTGDQPGDRVTLQRPDVHHNLTSFGESWEWLLGGSPTGVTAASLDYPDTASELTVRYRLYDGASLVTEVVYTPPQVTIAPVAPDLTNSVGTLTVDASGNFSFAKDEDWTNENLQLDEAPVLAGGGTLESWAPDGSFTLTAPSTPATLVLTATISNETGGTATKTYTVTVSEVLALDVGTTPAEAFTLPNSDAFVSSAFFGEIGSDVVQNNPNSPAGVMRAIWAGATGQYNILIRGRGDVDGENSQYRLMVGGVLVAIVQCDTSGNVFVDYIIENILITTGDAVELILDAQPSDAGDPAWLPTDYLTITEVVPVASGNLIANPASPAHADWSFNGGATFVEGVADPDGGTGAWRYVSAGNNDYAEVDWDGAIVGDSYTMRGRFRGESMANSRNLRINLFGTSNWIRIRDGSVFNTGLTATISSLGGGWYELTLTGTANATSGTLQMMVAASANSTSETDGSFDVYALKIDET